MDRANTKPSKPTRRLTQKRERSSASSVEFKRVMQESGSVLKKLWGKFRELLRKMKMRLKKLRRDFLISYTRWVDPRLEPYREKKLGQMERAPEAPVVVNEVIHAPEPPATRDDLFALMREAPMSVLSPQERKAMAAVLSLPDVKVGEIMTPQLKMVFVSKDEMLGPLTLDKLYRSGFTYFPVVDARKHIIGTLHTALLNSLDVKETQPAESVMDPRVYFIRMDYSLEQALKAFLRTNSQLMMVVDRYERLVGMLTFEQIMNYLFGEKFQDDFDRDNDRTAVAKRK